MAQEVYCEIVGKEVGLFTKKVQVEVDTGGAKGFWKQLLGDPLKDPKTGQIQTFNSMIDALNHMAGQGWAFVNAYAITMKDQNVYRLRAA